MKKIGIFLISIFLLMLSSSIGGFSFASSLEQPTYLIEPLFYQTSNSYGISSEEINTSTPIDEDRDQAMAGRSISPKSENGNQFEKNITISINEIEDNQSIYMYIFFGDGDYFHNLEICLSDGGNSASWQISYEILMGQVMHSSNTSNLRFGWQLIELPMSCAVKNGKLSQITSMSIKYKSPDATTNNYAKFMFYAPYIMTSQNSDITFSNKQNYYNFQINWGENIDKYCLGDKYVITSWDDMFDYCVIGDLDLLKISTNLYRFVFEVIDKNGDKQSTNMFSQNFEAQFDIEGTYVLRVTLYDSNGNWLWKYPDKQIEISEFVAIYLSDSLKGLSVNAKYVFDIKTDDLVQQYSNVVVENSNNNVADVYVSDGRLYVETKKAGTSNVKISVNASRANSDEDTYSYEYSLSVNKENSFSWITIIVGSISLLIIGVLVYIIMVRRRLIDGKYPKY